MNLSQRLIPMNKPCRLISRSEAPSPGSFYLALFANGPGGRAESLVRLGLSPTSMQLIQRRGTERVRVNDP